jgi:hypothetical protein
MKKSTLLLFWVLCSLYASPQLFKACLVAFYNCENLYDTIDNPLINDEDFTAQGIKKYTGTIYRHKLEQLATVFSRIGTDLVPQGPAIIGVAEIENDTVLSDLCKHPLIRNRRYRVIHFDSPDPRGIDVALLYHPAFFLPDTAIPISVQLPGNSKQAYTTRDILYVKGWLAGDPVHIYVNHWPSRRGGQERSDPAREAAAHTLKKHADSIRLQEPDARLIVMGDFNDDPDSPSIREGLDCSPDANKTGPMQFFNPWTHLFRSGTGTLANQDSWGLFDQILLSAAWISNPGKGWFFQKQYIYNQPFLRENQGRYRGYPMRTWDGNNYRGGFSDHFPTYLLLLKRIK